MGRNRQRSTKTGKPKRARVKASPKSPVKGKGKASSRSKKSKKQKVMTWRGRLGKALFLGCISFAAASVLIVLFYKVVNPPTTPLMWIRWMQAETGSDHPRFLKRWVPLEKISPRLAQAVLTSEDQKFFKHHGFDWAAVNNAIRWNMKSDRKIGASTISMQTARNVFLWQDRNWLRKGLEAWFTVLIEAFWSKQRILEVYFNVIEWGNGVFGCDQAAREYFHHPATTLSPLESAWLAAILPNPRQWSLPDRRTTTQQRQWAILTRMHRFRLPSNVLQKNNASSQL